MGRYRELYRQNRDRGILNPAETLSRLNREIFGCHMDKYLTMFYGVINWSNHQLRYSGGGQFPFPILFDGEHAGYVGKKSLPIGLFDFANYQTESLQLPPQFALVLISDGILETLPQTSPVSYTHLDVYKRQPYCSAIHQIVLARRSPRGAPAPFDPLTGS